jgi:type I restriction enzyme S subunit
MSKVDDLIRRLCPNGVQYQPVNRVFDLRNGYTPSKSNPTFWSGGDIPWFRMEDLRENGGILNHSLQQIPSSAVKGERLFPANSLLVATSATIGEHALITVPHLSNQRFTSLALKREYFELLDMKFIYYYGFKLDEWCLRHTTTSSFSSVDMSGFKQFRVPIPPLEVQEEIVRILDSFTSLEAELEAELEARKKQYEYYRSELVEHEDAPVLPVGEIVNNISSGRNKSRVDKGRFPVYGSTGQIGTADKASYSGDALLVARVGANAGRVNIVSGEYDVSDNTLIVTPTETWDVRFAFHQLTQMNLNQYAMGGGQPLVTGKILKGLRIHLPSLVEQGRAAAVLDRFDALVNDLSSGLPAEIAARRKQYEFYRDRLLSFKELAV